MHAPPECDAVRHYLTSQCDAVRHPSMNRANYAELLHCVTHRSLCRTALPFAAPHYHPLSLSHCNNLPTAPCSCRANPTSGAPQQLSRPTVDETHSHLAAPTPFPRRRLRGVVDLNSHSYHIFHMMHDDAPTQRVGLSDSRSLARSRQLRRSADLPHASL